MQLLLLKNLAAATMLATTLIGGANTYVKSVTTTANINATSQAVQREATPLDSWIEDLIQLESRGQEKLKILDVNGRYSYGCLQFQMNTFWNYGTKYGFLSDGDEDNLGILIYSCELQKEIAKAMIQERPGNWRHWYTSVAKKKLGRPPIEGEGAIAQ